MEKHNGTGLLGAETASVPWGLAHLGISIQEGMVSRTNPFYFQVTPNNNSKLAPYWSETTLKMDVWISPDHVSSWCLLTLRISLSYSIARLRMRPTHRAKSREKLKARFKTRDWTFWNHLLWIVMCGSKCVQCMSQKWALSGKRHVGLCLNTDISLVFPQNRDRRSTHLATGTHGFLA